MKFKRLFHKNIKLTLEECQELMAKSSYGNLELHGRKDITELPDGLTVEGRLDIGDSSITKLPKNLTVKGALFIDATAITEIPDDCNIGGGIYAWNSQLVKLPDNLIVNGWLDIHSTPITKLPKNLTVKGSLEVYNTAIADVSEVSLIVDGFIRCYANSPLVNLAFEDYEVEIIEDY